MNINIQQKDLKNIIFLYDNKSILDILKCVKVVISNSKIRFINLYKNNYIINELNIDDEAGEHQNFLCYIEDLKNLFSVITDNTVLTITKIDRSFIHFVNEGSYFKIPILSDDDFPFINIPMITTSFKIDLPFYYENIKNILIKTNDNPISEYLAFKINQRGIYVIHTDNYRLHSVLLNNETNIPNIDFAIPYYFFDLIGKHMLTLYLSDEYLILKNTNTLIILEKNEKIIDSFKKAFYYLNNINSSVYINKFSVNKRVFLEELKKHSMFSKDLTIHFKQNNVILYSNNDKINDSYIKTITQSYNIEFNEHQSIFIDLKFFIEFVKSHNESEIDIYLTHKNFIYSKNNFCVTKKK